MTITRMDRSTNMYGPDEITMTITVNDGVSQLGRPVSPGTHSHSIKVGTSTGMGADQLNPIYKLVVGENSTDIKELTKELTEEIKRGLAEHTHTLPPMHQHMHVTGVTS